MSMYDHPIETAKRAYVVFSPQTQSYLLQYINHLVHRQLSPGSIICSISAIKQFFSGLPSEKRSHITTITRDDIYQFVEKLTAKGLAPCSINTSLSHLKMLFFYMLDDELISSNPVLKRFYVKEPQRLPRPMFDADIAIFFQYIQGRPYEAIFLLMLRSGLRVGEACRLKWHDINWEKQQIIIHNGKGSVDRVVYFNNQVKKHFLEQKRMLLPWSPYCFPSAIKENGSLNPTTINWRMKRYLKDCSLAGKGYTPHSLRHSFATNMLNAGVSLWVIRDLMGHKNVDQTLEYAKLSNETIRASFFDAMENIEPQASSNFGRRYYGLS